MTLGTQARECRELPQTVAKCRKVKTHFVTLHVGIPFSEHPLWDALTSERYQSPVKKKQKEPVAQKQKQEEKWRPLQQCESSSDTLRAILVQ